MPEAGLRRSLENRDLTNLLNLKGGCCNEIFF